MADFRLIDPPRVDPKPVSPNRLMLLAMASAAALAAGLFVPFALAQLRPVFDAAQELRVKTSLPVLGVVSLLVNDVDVRRGRMSRWRFLAGSGGLIGFFAIALVWLSIMAARQVG